MTAAATVARWLAIVIAILGVVDPTLTSMREGIPDVAIIARTDRDLALARLVRDRLGKDYNVVDGPWDNAAATIVVGNSLPDHLPHGTVFAVRDTGVTIERFVVPPVVTSEARIPIIVNAPNADIELRANGAVVASCHAERSEGSALHAGNCAKDSLFSRSLTLTPWAAGVLTLEARAARGADTASAFAITRVVDRAHPVLFFDRRPSWMSTFVRRSLEADRRFAVASRVVTSRGISSAAGQPPSTLADPSLLELYDVIVIGAPTALTAGDVSGLEQFLRRRGGAVVLLYDAAPGRGVHDRLTGVTRWTTRTLRTPVTARAEEDTSALRLTEMAFPARWSGIQRTFATAPNADSSGNLVWATTIGLGQVIVSGALDSWKYRDRATSGFDGFWRATISRAAREATQDATIEATPNLARPGERVMVRVTVRDTLAVPEVKLDSSVIQMWRGDRMGEYVAQVRASAEGEHWLTVVAGPARAEAPLVVRPGITRVGRDEWSTIARVARASGGSAGPIDSVITAIRERVIREKRPERWFPMRSPWWIVAFATLLGLEWLIRRRRGLA
jgi:hypothetical protein